MARKGNVEWEYRKEEHVESTHSLSTDEEIPLPPEQQYTRIISFALRTDGVLIRSHRTKLDIPPEFGDKGYDFGWKIYSRKPKANAAEILERQGYVQTK